MRAAGLEDKPTTPFFREEYALNARTGLPPPRVARRPVQLLGRVHVRRRRRAERSREIPDRYRKDAVAMSETVRKSNVAVVLRAHWLICTLRRRVAIGASDGSASQRARVDAQVEPAMRSLDGRALDAADVVALGLATHCVASSSMDEICDALSALDGGRPPEAFADAVDATLQSFQIEPPGASAARAHADAIDACFSEPDVPSILSALDADASPFCAEAAASDPARLADGGRRDLEAVRRARGAKDDVLRTDFRVDDKYGAARRYVGGFYGGVRAALVDKDRRRGGRRRTTWARTSRRRTAAFGNQPL